MNAISTRYVKSIVQFFGGIDALVLAALTTLILMTFVFGALVGVVMVTAQWLRADMKELKTETRLLAMKQEEQTLIMAREKLMRSGDLWYNPVKNIRKTEDRLELIETNQKETQ